MIMTNLEFSLPTGLSQASQEIKVFFSETTNKAVSAVTETTQRSKGVLDETASKAVNTLKDTTNKAVGVVAQTAEKATNTLTQTTEQAVNQVTRVSEQAVDSVTQTAQEAKASLNEMVQGGESLTGSIADAVETQLNHSIHTWMIQHPLIAWGVSHPLLALGIVLLFIVLLRALLNLLAQGIEKAWLALFKSPLALGKFLLASSRRLMDRNREHSPRQTLPEQEELLSLAAPEQQIQLAQILQKLEALNQEQSQLLQKLVILLETNK